MSVLTYTHISYTEGGRRQGIWIAFDEIDRVNLPPSGPPYTKGKIGTIRFKDGRIDRFSAKCCAAVKEVWELHLAEKQEVPNGD